MITAIIWTIVFIVMGAFACDICKVDDTLNDDGPDELEGGLV